MVTEELLSKHFDHSIRRFASGILRKQVAFRSIFRVVKIFSEPQNPLFSLFCLLLPLESVELKRIRRRRIRLLGELGTENRDCYYELYRLLIHPSVCCFFASILQSSTSSVQQRQQLQGLELYQYQHSNRFVLRRRMKLLQS